MCNTLINGDIVPWRKMTPEEYAEQHKSFGSHMAITVEVVKGCQEVHVFLGDNLSARVSVLPEFTVKGWNI